MQLGTSATSECKLDTDRSIYLFGTMARHCCSASFISVKLSILFASLLVD